MQEIQFTSTILFRETSANSCCYVLRGTEFECDQAQIESLEGSCEWNRDFRQTKYRLRFTLKSSVGEIEFDRLCDGYPYATSFEKDASAINLTSGLNVRIRIETQDSDREGGTGYGNPSVYRADVAFKLLIDESISEDFDYD